MHCTHIHAPSGQPLSAPQGSSVACSWLPPSIFFDGSFQTQFLLLKSPSPALALMIYSFFSSLVNEDACLPSSSPSQLPQNGLYFLLKKFFLAAESLRFRQWGSFIAACGLSCCLACASLAPLPGIKPASPPLQGEFLTNGSLEKPYIFLFFGWIDKVQRPLRITAPS